MSEPQPLPGHLNDQNSQMIVALSIVVALLVLGIGLIIAGVYLKDGAATTFGIIGTIIGALATALNAPSGVSAVIAASKKPAPAPDPPTDPTPVKVVNPTSDPVKTDQVAEAPFMERDVP